MTFEYFDAAAVTAPNMIFWDFDDWCYDIIWETDLDWFDITSYQFIGVDIDPELYNE